jgi:hypothetical protein
MFWVESTHARTSREHLYQAILSYSSRVRRFDLLSVMEKTTFLEMDFEIAVVSMSSGC